MQPIGNRPAVPLLLRTLAIGRQRAELRFHAIGLAIDLPGALVFTTKEEEIRGKSSLRGSFEFYAVGLR
jgi:hypothetical protein